MMHMMFAALTGALQPMALASPLYCATVLLRRGQNIKVHMQGILGLDSFI
jgi:hypothetical protein